MASGSRPIRSSGSYSAGFRGAFTTVIGPPRPERYTSDDLAHPPEGVLGAAVLDVDQGLADGEGEVGRRRRRCRAAPPAELADRRDDGRGAAGEDLGDLAAGHAVAPLVDREPALLDLVAHLAGQLD